MCILAFEAEIPPQGQCLITSRVQRPFLPLRFQVASPACRILSLSVMGSEILLASFAPHGISAEHFPVFTEALASERTVEFVNLMRKPVYPGIDIRLQVESDVQHFALRFKGAVIGLVMSNEE